MAEDQGKIGEVLAVTAPGGVRAPAALIPFLKRSTSGSTMVSNCEKIEGVASLGLRLTNLQARGPMEFCHTRDTPSGRNTSARFGKR